MQKKGRFIVLIRVVILIFAGLLALPGLGDQAKADDYPTKPINLLIPMAAGGATDQIMRAITPTMEKVLKTSIVIQYKTGGGGTIAWSWLSRQEPDGYNIGAFTHSLLLQQYGKVGGVKIDQLDFIANAVFADGCLSVRNDSPFKDFKELLDYAKKNPEVVTVSNSGTGAVWHLLAAGVGHRAGVKFTHVPMTGGGPATLAMMGGHVTMSAGAVGEVVKFAQAGKARVLAVATEARSPNLPDVPTLKELGIDFQWGSAAGFIGPRGVPEKRLQILSDAIEKGYQSSQFQDMMRTLGYRTVLTNYKEIPRFIKTEDEKCRELLKLVGLF